MIKHYIAFFILFFFIKSLIAQDEIIIDTLSNENECSYLTISKRIFAFEGITPKNLEICTKPRTLFDKLWFGGSTAIAKAGDKYFLRIGISKRFSTDFNIEKNNPLLLNFSDSTNLKLEPYSNYSGQRIVDWYHIVSFYEISYEQLESFSSKSIISSDIYITTSSILEGSKRNELGTCFEIDILSEKNQSNLKHPANCLLNSDYSYPDDYIEYSSKTKKTNVNKYSKSLIYSAALPISPFGIKFYYCKTFGFYASLRSDLGTIYDNTFLTLGGAYSFANNFSTYLGTGYDFFWDDKIIEGGLVYKINRIAFDLGGGYLMDLEEGYLTIGVGFNF